MNRMILTLGGVLSASSLLLMDSAIKGTVLLSLAAVLALLLRRDSAATRHLVWMTAIVALLVVPVLSATLPQWRVLPNWMSSPRTTVAAIESASPPALPMSAVEVIELPQRATSIAPMEVDPSAAPDLQPVAQSQVLQPSMMAPREIPAQVAGTWSWMNAIPLVWAIGFGILMLRLSAARWMLWNSERLAIVIGRQEASRRDPIVIAMTALCSKLKIRRPITLLIHPHKTIPVVWGIFRCRLMLPVAARQWSDEQLQSVLMHELAHIKRGDTLVQLLTQVACALHWFNPLVWFAAWRLDVERERSCDDLVLASGIRPSAYAAHLLDVVSGLSPARWTQACGLAMARKSSLEGRLAAVLGKDLNRRSVSVTLAGVAMLLAVGIAVPIAMLRGAQPVETNLDADAMNSEPNDDKSKALFENWKASARTDGKIPGGRIGELATELKTRIDLNPGNQSAVGWEEALKKCDVTRDWSPSEAALLLDEIEVAVPGLAESAMWTNKERMIHFGKALPAELKDAPWGSPEAQGEQLDASSVALRGLRMAWLLEPKEESHALDEVLKSRVLFHNTGKIPVCFATESWIQSGMHTAKDAAGKEISVWATQLLGERTRMIFCLAPGEYAEVQGHSIGIGSHESATNKRTQLAGAWIEAKPGDLVTFVPAKLNVSFQTWQNNEGRKEPKTVWNETIAARVAQEGPWPMSVADRELLIKRVTVDLGIPLPNEELKGELLSDNSSDGLAKLTAQLQAAGASMHYSGELSRGETTFKVTEARPNDAALISPADEPQAIMPKQKDARAFYEVWQRFARANGDIPGALVGELAKAIKVFIGYNPTWETVPKLNAILPRLDATHDWKPADAIALLDEVAGVQVTILEPAPWKGTRQGIRQGEALPKKFADASWGEEQPNGLRAAWLLEPSATEHRIGAALKARLLVQNRGQVPVMLQVPTWHQGQVKANDANGKEVEASGLEWTTMAMLNTVRLGPGDYIEINTPGVGIGPRAGMGPWAGPRVGSNVLAKPGDELTLTYSLVPLDGSEVGVSEEDPHVAGPSWWLAHIKTRLNRELPLPTDAAERTRILDRAVHELFVTAPTAEETEAFIADKSPESIDALAKRLAARTDAVSFSGKLPTAPVKFRVLDAAADADNQPRVVLGPGEYPLPCTTADRGQATLKIVGKQVGDRRTNEAQILFEATEATGIVPPDPHKLEVPDGWGTWAIACRPSDGYLYLLHKGTVRKIDYSKPRNITDTPTNDLPAEFRDEVKRQLDIHEISAAQQAEIFEKSVLPAASLRSDAQVKPKPGAMIKPATEQKLKWGEAVNGLRMALAWPPVLGEPELGDKPEFYLVVQNVSDKGVRLTSNDTAPNPRMLDLYDTTIVSRSVDDKTIPGDWLLQPREAAFVRLIHSEQKFKDGRTTSILKENVVSTLGQYSFTAAMTIETAPAGAWTGKLVTGATRGSADVLEAGKPIELRSAPPMSWGAPKDGLRGAVRIIGELRTGGQAKAELWVWNASVDVVKLSWTERADIGLAIMMADGTNAAREAPVTRDKKDFQLHYLVLPAGQAVKLKEFVVRLGSPPNDAPAGTVSLPLTPGHWTLQAKWSDSRHIVDAAPEWHGVLDTGELKLTVTPEGATVAEAAAVKAKWPPVRQKTEWSEEFLAHSKAVAEARGTPDAKPENLIAWGLEENGLRAGLLMAPQVTLGGQLPSRMVLRNVSNDVRELGLSLSLNRLKATAQTPDGKSLQVHKNQLRGVDALYKVTLFPGEQVEFEGPPVQFGVEQDGETKKVRTPKFPICGVETGVAKVHVRFTVQASTGLAVVEVAAAKAGAANPQPKGAINAEAAMVRLDGKGKDADGKTVVLMLFEELQRDEATSTVRVKSVDGGGGSVGSSLFIVQGACEIAKARGATYFAKLKEWEAEDGTWMYLLGFSKNKDIRPLTNEHQLKIFAVSEYEFLFKDPAAADADKPQEKLAELESKIAGLKMQRERLSGRFGTTHPNIRKLDAEMEALEKARTAFVATNPQANADANIVKVPDDQYMKSGVPVDELAGEGVIWNDVQNGLSLGYRITGDEWRILGKDVKVELWVQNHGDKDVKFQDNLRADTEFGLRVKLKDAKGEVHDSNFWPDDRPPFGFHRLLPPGHALKIKEFTVSLVWPSNDFSNAKGHFLGINPGAYNLHCELELPGFYATGEGGKQLTPAAGEWTGKLTTRGLNVEVIAPDAPASKPRIESVDQSAVSADLEKAAESIRRLARLSPVPSNKELEAAINLLVTSTDNNLANRLVLQLANHRISETTQTIDPIRLTGFTILMTREKTSTLAFLRSVKSTAPEKEQRRIDQLIGAVERSALNKVAPQSASKPKVTPKERRQVATFFEEPVYQDQLEGYSTHADRLLELVTRRLTADYRAREKLTLKEEWIEALAKVVWQKIQEKPQDELNAKLSEEQRFGMSHAWGLASMQDWLLTKSLYERYGGRVGFGSLGLWLAPDGRNALIKEAIEAGNFKIHDSELEKAFWENANKKNFADAYPTGEDLKRYLSYPPQLGN